MANRPARPANLPQSGQVRQFSVHRVTPQCYEPIVERMPHPQRLPHRRDLLRNPSLPQRSPHHGDRLQPDRSPGCRPRHRLQPRGQAHAVHQRPQLGHQVEGGFDLATVQQPGHHHQRGVLRQLHPVPVAVERGQQLGLAGVGEVPQVEPLPIGASRRTRRQGTQPVPLVGSQRRLRQVPAGREAAMRDLQRHPRRGVGDRRPRPDGQPAFRHARHDRSPLRDPGLGVRPRGRVVRCGRGS